MHAAQRRRPATPRTSMGASRQPPARSTAGTYAKTRGIAVAERGPAEIGEPTIILSSTRGRYPPRRQEARAQRGKSAGRGEEADAPPSGMSDGNAAAG